jgi:hypothetical protein
MRRALNISAAVAGAAIAFSKPIFKIIDRLSEMDFLATYAGPVGRFLETGWGTLSSIAVGAAIIGFSIYQGLRQRRADPAVTAKSRIGAPLLPATRSTAPKKADEPESIFIPRISRTHIRLISDETGLLELAQQQDVVILHVLTKLNSLTQGYVEDLVSILESLTHGNPQLSALEHLDIIGRIRDLTVLLKCPTQNRIDRIRHGPLA